MTDAEFARRVERLKEWILEHWDEKGMLDWIMDMADKPILRKEEEKE